MLSLGKMIKRCVSTLVGTDNRDIRVQQVSRNGQAVDAEIYAPYGMSYNLPEDCVGVYLVVGGDPGDLVVFPDRSQDRVKNLKRGEVAFFNPLTQSKTVYRKNGDVEITTDGDNGTMTTTIKKDQVTTVKGDKSVTVSGAMSVDVTGDVTISSDGDIDLTAQGDINITATGNVNISGAAVNLN